MNITNKYHGFSAVLGASGTLAEDFFVALFVNCAVAD